MELLGRKGKKEKTRDRKTMGRVSGWTVTSSGRKKRPANFQSLVPYWRESGTSSSSNGACTGGRGAWLRHAVVVDLFGRAGNTVALPREEGRRGRIKGRAEGRGKN